LPLDDSIYPFRNSDFAIDEVLDELALSKPRLGLLKRMLNELAVTIWFSTGDNGSSPFVELLVFWEDSEIDSLVSKTDLPSFLERVFNQRNELGDEEEIIALEKLKAVIDAALKTRRDDPIKQTS
jgi:hypothetical protein